MTRARSMRWRLFYEGHPAARAGLALKLPSDRGRRMLAEVRRTHQAGRWFWCLVRRADTILRSGYTRTLYGARKAAEHALRVLRGAT